MFAVNGLRSAAGVARRFRTPEARALFAGAAAHGMMPLTARPTGAVGLMLTGLAHAVGWPVAEGGSARITDAMAEAVVAAGGTIETGRWVRSLAELPPARAVLFDVAPRGLLSIAGDRLPPRYRHALRRFRYGAGVCKADFALSGPVPWANEACRRAGTLHLGGTYEEIAAAEVAGRRRAAPGGSVRAGHPAGRGRPDPGPGGLHTLWAYCHVPAGSAVDMTGRIEAQIERFAPGFRDLMLARHTRTAADEEAREPELRRRGHRRRHADVRQTVFRPAARWNPYRTPLPGGTCAPRLPRRCPACTAAAVSWPR